MSQERPVGLATVSTKRELAPEFELKEPELVNLISEFSNLKTLYK